MADGSKELNRGASTTSGGDGDHSDTDSDSDGDEPCEKKARDEELSLSLRASPSPKRHALPDQASRWASYKPFNRKADDGSWSLFGIKVEPFNIFDFGKSK